MEDIKMKRWYIIVMIGKTFCHFCGEKAGAILAYKGSIWFQGKLQFLPLNEFLKDYKIEV
jgi:hypothetical protein